MKHLTIQVKRVVRIVEQTNRGESFSNQSGGRVFKASNGFCLVSEGAPEAREDRLFVRGYYKADDEMEVDVPSDEWLADLQVAVREYNAAHQDEAGEKISSYPKIIE